MKRFLNRALMFLLCTVILFSATVTSTSNEVVAARTLMDIENDLKEYKDLLSELQTELTEISKKIAELEGKSGETTELLIYYQAEIDILEANIMKEEAEIDSIDLTRAAVIAEIAIVQEDYDYRMSMYKKLMQYIYENDNVNSFELLFSSENFEDFLTQRDHFNDIMTTADQLLKELEVSIADLETLDKEHLAVQAKYEEHLKELNKQKINLEKKIDEFETIASDLNIDSEELAKQYQERNSKIVTVKNKIAELEKERKAILSSNAAFIWPVKTDSYRVTSQYGWRGDPFGGSSTEYHKGIDIACSRGVPIVAVKDGVVTKAQWHGGYGECVIIYHGNGISSLYAHIDNSGKNGDLPYMGQNGKPTYWVKEGDTVKAGQVIAYVGTTGRSTGNHLHFGVIDTNTYTSLGGNYVNPNKYLPDGYYTKKS